MRGTKTGIVAILAVGLSAGSTVGLSDQDSATGSSQGEPGLDVRELEWRPLDLDEATFGPGARLADIAASDSRLAIGGSVDGNAAVWTSTDGLEWERVPHDDEVFGGPADQEIKAIVPWRDGFVAAGEVDPGSDFHPQRVAAVWISVDGKDWARVPHDEEVFGGKGRQEMFDIAASDDRLVIVGFDEEGPCCSDARADHDIAVWTSDDGSEWTQQTFGGGEMLALAGTAEGFVGVGHRGMWTSPDGLRWEREDPGLLRHALLLGVAPTPSGFVAVGLDTPPGERPGAWTSSDGADWTPAEIAAPLMVDEWWMPQDVALAGSGLAHVGGPNRYGDGTSTILVSEDGRSWVPGDTSAPVSDAHLRKITAFGDHFVAIGSAQNPWEPGQAGIWTTLEPSELGSETDGPAGAEPVERDTTTSPDLLPGVDLVTEEVGPGVYRVLSDGVREISILPADEARWMGGVMDTNIAAGPDGSVWLFGLDGFFRLGEEAWHGWYEDFQRDVSLGQADFEVGPDGTLWLHHWLGVDKKSRNNGNIWSFDGETWTTRRDGTKNEYLYGIEVQQDGTVWTAWHTANKRKRRATAARLGANGWEELPGTVSGGLHGDIVISDGGGDHLWLMPDLRGRLRRHDGSGWVVQRTPEAGGEMRAAVGADGTLWVRLHPTCGHGTVGDRPSGWCAGQSDILARLDGETWEVSGSTDGIPMMGDHYMGFEGFFEVDPDRSIWFNPIGDSVDDYECDGIASLDGQKLRRYLRDHCITAMDMAPHGTVWLRTMERAPDPSGTPDRPSPFHHLPNKPIHTYAITREAVEATEHGG